MEKEQANKIILRHRINQVIDCLKKAEGHYFDKEVPRDELTSNKWSQKLCMLDGGYSPTFQERFKWFADMNYTLEAAAIALHVMEKAPKSEKVNEPEDRQFWHNVYGAAWSCSEELLKTLKERS
ncbi:hypothetical protein LCGC14_0469660 [marine sediment metagenome]|uniref:Uncharacterized protein n=1 Tax=marine sediment metagenome TaxID=412755 RepID=A0A0F9UZC3_9ZZZZ